MSEDKKVTILKKEYQRKIENINKRTSMNRKAINKFKAEFRNRPLVLNVKVIKNLFSINTDALHLKVLEGGLKDLEEKPNLYEKIKREVKRANAEINRGIAPRRREMNLVINEYRKNMNKKSEQVICSSCGIKINANKITCEKCAESIGIFDKAFNFCDKCGKKIPESSKFCPGCGKSL